jgi:hypothetical protein
MKTNIAAAPPHPSAKAPTEPRRYRGKPTLALVGGIRPTPLLFEYALRFFYARFFLVGFHQKRGLHF